MSNSPRIGRLFHSATNFSACGVVDFGTAGHDLYKSR